MGGSQSFSERARAAGIIQICPRVKVERRQNSRCLGDVRDKASEEIDCIAFDYLKKRFEKLCPREEGQFGYRPLSTQGKI